MLFFIGASFRCWQNNTAITEYVGVESNKYFKSHLEDIEKSRNYSFPISTVWIKGENIDIEPNSFDYVVTTHVLCSVDSVHQILQQVKRALKTNGKYFFLEHVQDFNNNTWTFYFQQILSPIFYIFGNGCKFLPIWRNFQQFEELEGFKVEVQNFTSPHPLSVIQPHIKGVAVKN